MKLLGTTPAGGRFAEQEGIHDMLREFSAQMAVAIFFAWSLAVGLQCASGQEQSSEELAANPFRTGQPATSDGDKRGNATSEIEIQRLTQDFERRDKDEDGQLTVKEFVGSRSADKHESAQRTFARLDADNNGVVSLAEFLNRSARLASADSLFRRRDLDGDGKLSEEEFIQTRRGKTSGEGWRQNFAKCDLDGDGYLNRKEFSLLPGRKPSGEELFAALDMDGSETLDLGEFLATHREDRLSAGRREFFQRDLNDDGQLRREEFLLSPEQLPAEPANRFKMLDSDDDGSICLAEFFGRTFPVDSTDILKVRRYEVALMNAEQQFLLADADGDNRLSNAEFEEVGRVREFDVEQFEPAGAGSARKTTIRAGSDWDPLVVSVVAADGLLIFAALAWVARRKKQSVAVATARIADPSPATSDE